MSGRRGARAAGSLVSGAVLVGLLAPTGVQALPQKAPPAVAGEAPSPSARSESESLAMARSSGEPVEVVSLRSETSEVFATPEGNFEARQYLRPVRARVAGEWKPVDTVLVRDSTGVVAPKAVTIGLEFSGGGSAPLVRMVKAGRELTLSWPTSLPAPVLQGDTATYPEVLPGVDLRLGAKADGFTQLLVVKSAAAAANPALNEVRLSLDAQGMTLREQPGGGLEAVDDGAGGAVFEAPRPVMWDSSTGSGAAARKGGASVARQGGADVGGEPGAGESGTLAPVGVEIPADQSALVLEPDAALLRGAETVYPVFIDPQFHAPKANAWTMASEYWANSPQWQFNGDADAGLGYCDWAECMRYDTKRLFYQFDTTRFWGKSILSAEFAVRNTHSASCSARGVELWKTKAIDKYTHWNEQEQSGFWIDHLRTSSFAYGFTGCAARDAEFDVKTAVQQSATAKNPKMTFGLRASSESDKYGWKRFSDDASLRVLYNRPPPQVKMSQLSMQYGGVCKKPADAPRSRSLGLIHADNVTDPDGDTVAVEFRAIWDGGRWPALPQQGVRTSVKASGSDFHMSLPSSLPQNKQIGWEARVWDGGQYSPWSSAGDPTMCYFSYDATVPRSPALSSLDFPASDPENPDDPWYDGTGRYGVFEMDANDSQVTKYWYGINADPTSDNTVTTTAGAAKTITFLPPKPGLNTLYVKSFDAAGNVSAPTSYRFRVKAGQPERGTWSLDEETGTQAVGTAPARTAVLHGGATPGVSGALGTAVRFDGVNDYARTDIPTVATDTGFSVSAWAKLSSVPGTSAVVVAQPGNHNPGFQLYYSGTYDRWAFVQYRADDPNATTAMAMQAQAGGVSANEWVHLVGTHSATDDELKLYVDGVLAGTTAYDSPWDARRGLQIGAGSHNGDPRSFFPGAIDEVQIFDKTLSQGEVTRLKGKDSLISGRPARAVFSMDEAADKVELNGVPEVLPAEFRGGVTKGATGVVGQALELNGTTGYATTERPMLNNQRSYTVSAWARLPKTKPDHAAVVTMQAGVHKPGFELYYSHTFDRWGIRAFTTDDPDASQVQALQPSGSTARGGEWAHLVGVHDSVTNELTFYLNGKRAGSTTLVADWYAGGPVQIGAGQYGGQPGSFFPGRIDDVRLYDRPVSAGEVQQMFKQRPVVKARWKFASSSGTPAKTPDSSSFDHDMTLHGGAQVGPDKGWVDGGIVLDGVNDHGMAEMPTDTGGSFTIAGWAQAAAEPTGPVTLLSAAGLTKNALTVRYEPGWAAVGGPGRWRVTIGDRDGLDVTFRDAANGQFSESTEWNHLAVVYDGFDKQVSLYVNGELEGTSCAGEDDCLERSHEEDVLSFTAAELHLGRQATGTSTGNQYWPGAVSDLWAFQGVLTEPQIHQLAVGQPGLPTTVPGSG
ncbi:LamG-like jellyroll fold domain-containing protein [Streptomyces sp. NPDC059256]|uniref:LamG-like jellyroll fold domain-containing protein n=1 Tax=Streptomyces sp. NPDC059256 TaxID=3346794 RepID=UPI003691EBA1